MTRANQGKQPTSSVVASETNESSSRIHDAGRASLRSALSWHGINIIISESIHGQRRKIHRHTVRAHNAHSCALPNPDVNCFNNFVPSREEGFYRVQVYTCACEHSRVPRLLVEEAASGWMLDRRIPPFGALRFRRDNAKIRATIRHWIGAAFNDRVQSEAERTDGSRQRASQTSESATTTKRGVSLWPVVARCRNRSLPPSLLYRGIEAFHPRKQTIQWSRRTRRSGASPADGRRRRTEFRGSRLSGTIAGCPRFSPSPVGPAATLADYIENACSDIHA